MTTEPLVKDWELYDSKRGSTRAVKALNAALNRAAKKLVGELKKRKLGRGDNESIGKLIADIHRQVMEPVMSKYADFGATDTEPRYNAVQGLMAAAKDHFGIVRKAQMFEWGRYL